MIKQEIDKEEEKFRKTLKEGLREFEKISQDGSISGKDVFLLFSTYGFPYELTFEIAKERSVCRSTKRNFERR